jgi:hypothetical protein
MITEVISLLPAENGGAAGGNLLKKSILWEITYGKFNSAGCRYIWGFADAVKPTRLSRKVCPLTAFAI